LIPHSCSSATVPGLDNNFRTWYFLLMTALAIQLTHPTAQADSDEHLISLFLYEKSPHTIRAYTLEIRRFQAYVGKPLQAVTLGDLQAFVSTLSGSDNTKARTTAALKSLLTFGQELGYLQYNVGAALKRRKVRETLSQRILTESQVIHMIELEKNPRNRALLRTLYLAGLRNSEASNLRWSDLIARDAGEGQLSIFGKGGKTRVILVPASLWAELQAIRGEARPEDPVFLSMQKGPLCGWAIVKVVRDAAQRAGIKANVTPHWLRHCHASHSLDRNAPMHLVKETLGHASLQTTSLYTHARPGESSAKYLPS